MKLQNAMACGASLLFAIALNFDGVYAFLAGLFLAFWLELSYRWRDMKGIDTMKISEMITEIVQEAESKFGISQHRNDNIGVWMWMDLGSDSYDEPIWWVGLERPSQRQLNMGSVVAEHIDSVKLNETRYGFTTSASSLMEALRFLQEKVDNAYEEDFQPEV